MSNHLQQIASDPKNSAWVFASAGSGKTKILTNRVLRLLLENILPGKILCLTFTNAAASEMESRINENLSDWVICSDEELQEKLTNLSGKTPSIKELEKARTLLVKILDSDSKIKVQTIHSFCQSLIKIFPFEANVKPNFELLDESGEKLLLKEAQKQIKKLAEDNSEIRQIITKINSSIHEESLSDLVSNLLSKKDDLTFLKEEFFGINGVIDEIYKKFGISKNDNEEVIFAKVFAKINQSQLSKLANYLSEMKQKTNVKFGQQIQDFLRNITPNNFPLYKSAFLTTEESLRKFYEKLDEEFMQIAQEQYQLILEFSEKINSLKIVENSALLLKFCDLILENYSNLKKQKAFLDYDDLIIETNRLLQNPDHSEFVKLKMDSGFDHILVDESQDTNSKQWNIIKALSEDFFSGMSASQQERSVFIVGDEKQSIFSFQGADINLGNEVFTHFKDRLGDNLKEIELNTSYRSGSEILSAVDEVFKTPQRQNAITKLGKFTAHKAARTTKSLVEIWPQIKNDKEKSAEKNYEWPLHFLEEDREKEATQMAKTIALKIENWIAKEKQITGKNRALNYGDIMILLRSRKGEFSRQLVKFFHQYGIPFSSISRLKFSESLLIGDLLSAAKFCLLPKDDLNLACLLKSPFFLISEEELLEICLKKNQDKSSLYDAISNDEIKNTLQSFIEKSRQLNCFEFFYYLLRQSNFDKNFIAYFGNQALQIIDKFFEIVMNFNQSTSPNLQQFLEFIEVIDPEIILNETANNSVKITTIHSSKGLQSPVIIVPDCCYNPRRSPSNKDGIFWIDNLPIWCSKKSDENALIKEYREKRFVENSEEYLRLLYVAMTRAEDELYIGGFGNDSTPDCWYEIIKNSLPQNILSEFEELNEVKKPEKFKTKSLDKNSLGNQSLGKKEQRLSQVNHGTIKGKLIHKILEIFGKNYTADKIWLKDLAQNIIEKEELFSQKEKSDILIQANDFLDSELFNQIFNGEIKCEFEIVNNGNLQRIDLLTIKENEIMIIDYKSDESLSDEVLIDYKFQLDSYKKAVEKIYPNKNISTAILWTKNLELRKILS